jgi:hypothetical protein
MCLADAMEALGAAAMAPKLLSSKVMDERRAGLRLMITFASDDYLPYLRDTALNDADPAIRARALEVLEHQLQTPKWEEVIATFLAQPDTQLRGWAIDRLIKHNSDATWARVQAHAATEQDPVWPPAVPASPT